MLKRITLFLLVNILVVLTITCLLSFFQVQPYLTARGIDYQSLALFCFIWGMSGALISLALSRVMVKWMLTIRIINPDSCNHDERAIYDMVAQLAQRAHLPEIPQVGIYDSPEPNAFATGPSKRRALVALSTGILKSMPKEEIEAVVGHELSHVANGDMVTMSLLQGVVNAFVMFLSRVLAFVLSGVGGRDNGRSRSYATYWACTILFEIVFMILGSLIVAAFSRYREFRADRGSADLLGTAPMIAALRRLARLQAIQDPAVHQPAIAALMITQKGSHSLLRRLFSSHPPLEERITRLEESGR